MKRLLLALALVAGAAVLPAGCEPAPSTPLAPEVKKPDFGKMSGKELLDYKKSHDAP